MTDREVMMAVYAAIEKLFVELTGKPLTVAIETANGIVKIKSLEG